MCPNYDRDEHYYTNWRPGWMQVLGGSIKEILGHNVVVMKTAVAGALTRYQRPSLVVREDKDGMLTRGYLEKVEA